MQTLDDEVVSNVIPCCTWSLEDADLSGDGESRIWRFDFAKVLCNSQGAEEEDGHKTARWRGLSNICDADGDLAPRRAKRRVDTHSHSRGEATAAEGISQARETVSIESRQGPCCLEEAKTNTCAASPRARLSECTPLSFSVKLEVLTKSSALLCGLQVWGAALLLVDFVVSEMPSFRDQVVVELGAGSGLPGLVLARVCRRVFLTDFVDEVLQQCRRNVVLNSAEECCRVRRIDWTEPDLAGTQGTRLLREPGSAQERTRGEAADSEVHDAGFCAEATEDEFRWRNDDLGDLEACSTFVAADVIYSNDITDAFLAQAKRLLCAPSGAGPRARARKLYVAVEQRFNFTLPECTTTSREYDYWLARLETEFALDCASGKRGRGHGRGNGPRGKRGENGSVGRRPSGRERWAEGESREDEDGGRQGADEERERVAAKELALDFAQYGAYERKHMHLWCLSTA
jgi:predicted nicotinamide N-methyase